MLPWKFRWIFCSTSVQIDMQWNSKFSSQTYIVLSKTYSSSHWSVPENSIEISPGEMDIYSFYAGKSIFLTGGSGFIGKLLIEKFLRSIPELDKIYVLIRNKKGRGAQERLNFVLRNSVSTFFSISIPFEIYIHLI